MPKKSAPKKSPREGQSKPSLSRFANEIGMAQVAFERGEIVRAQHIAAAVLQAEPDNADASLVLGLCAFSRKDPASIPFLKHAVNAYPKRTSIRFHYAIALRYHGYLSQAADELTVCVKQDYKYPKALNMLGVVLHQLRRTTEAEQTLARALAITPNDPQVLCNLGAVWSVLGDKVKSLEFYEQSRQLNPQNAINISNLLLTYNYCDHVPAQEVFARHVAYMDALYPQNTQAENAADARQGTADGQQPCRIGFVSPDFRAHSVAFFLQSYLEVFDRSRYQLFMYYNNTFEDEVTQWIRGKASEFRTIHDLTTEQATTLIKNDHIDILIDLAGHTHKNRLDIFARRAAPVQVSWLGYPNTTGLRTVDFRIVDDITDPPGAADALNTETLIRLPRGFLCYAGDAEQLYQHALPSQTQPLFTFASFNNSEKITDRAIECWVEILARTQNTRLLLKSYNFNDQGIRARYLKRFQAAGVELARVELLEAIEGNHLRAYDRVDLALDTFPYNGTTTTCEALWMGVPTLCIEGQVHAARVGASLLHRVGLDDFIARSEQDYIERAVAFAESSEKRSHLAALRSAMRQRLQASDLCNKAQFATELERAFQKMLALASHK